MLNLAARSLIFISFHREDGFRWPPPDGEGKSHFREELMMKVAGTMASNYAAMLLPALVGAQSSGRILEAENIRASPEWRAVKVGIRDMCLRALSVPDSGFEQVWDALLSQKRLEFRMAFSLPIVFGSIALKGTELSYGGPICVDMKLSLEHGKMVRPA